MTAIDILRDLLATQWERDGRAEDAIERLARLVDTVREHQTGMFECQCGRCRDVREALAAALGE